MPPKTPKNSAKKNKNTSVVGCHVITKYAVRTTPSKIFNSNSDRKSSVPSSLPTRSSAVSRAVFQVEKNSSKMDDSVIVISDSDDEEPTLPIQRPPVSTNTSGEVPLSKPDAKNSAGIANMGSNKNVSTPKNDSIPKNNSTPSTPYFTPMESSNSILTPEPVTNTILRKQNTTKFLLTPDTRKIMDDHIKMLQNTNQIPQGWKKKETPRTMRSSKRDKTGVTTPKIHENEDVIPPPPKQTSLRSTSRQFQNSKQIIGKNEEKHKNSHHTVSVDKNQNIFQKVRKSVDKNQNIFKKVRKTLIENEQDLDKNSVSSMNSVVLETIVVGRNNDTPPSDINIPQGTKTLSNLKKLTKVGHRKIIAPSSKDSDSNHNRAAEIEKQAVNDLFQDSEDDLDYFTAETKDTDSEDERSPAEVQSLHSLDQSFQGCHSPQGQLNSQGQSSDEENVSPRALYNITDDQKQNLKQTRQTNESPLRGSERNSEMSSVGQLTSRNIKRRKNDENSDIGHRLRDLSNRSDLSRSSGKTILTPTQEVTNRVIDEFINEMDAESKKNYTPRKNLVRNRPKKLTHKKISLRKNTDIDPETDILFHKLNPQKVLRSNWSKSGRDLGVKAPGCDTSSDDTTERFRDKTSLTQNVIPTYKKGVTEEGNKAQKLLSQNDNFAYKKGVTEEKKKAQKLLSQNVNFTYKKGVTKEGKKAQKLLSQNVNFTYKKGVTEEEIEAQKFLQVLIGKSQDFDSAPIQNSEIPERKSKESLSQDTSCSNNIRKRLRKSVGTGTGSAPTKRPRTFLNIEQNNKKMSSIIASYLDDAKKKTKKKKGVDKPLSRKALFPSPPSQQVRDNLRQSITKMFPTNYQKSPSNLTPKSRGDTGLRSPPSNTPKRQELLSHITGKPRQDTNLKSSVKRLLFSQALQVASQLNSTNVNMGLNVTDLVLRSNVGAEVREKPVTMPMRSETKSQVNQNNKTIDQILNSSCELREVYNNNKIPDPNSSHEVCDPNSSHEVCDPNSSCKVPESSEKVNLSEYYIELSDDDDDVIDLTQSDSEEVHDETGDLNLESYESNNEGAGIHVSVSISSISDVETAHKNHETADKNHEVNHEASAHENHEAIHKNTIKEHEIESIVDSSLLNAPNHEETISHQPNHEKNHEISDNREENISHQANRETETCLLSTPKTTNQSDQRKLLSTPEDIFAHVSNALNDVISAADKQSVPQSIIENETYAQVTIALERALSQVENYATEDVGIGTTNDGNITGKVRIDASEPGIATTKEGIDATKHDIDATKNSLYAAKDGICATELVNVVSDTKAGIDATEIGFGVSSTKDGISTSLEVATMQVATGTNQTIRDVTKTSNTATEYDASLNGIGTTMIGTDDSKNKMVEDGGLVFEESINTIKKVCGTTLRTYASSSTNNVELTKNVELLDSSNTNATKIDGDLTKAPCVLKDVNTVVERVADINKKGSVASTEDFRSKEYGVNIAAGDAKNGNDASLIVANDDGENNVPVVMTDNSDVINAEFSDPSPKEDVQNADIDSNVIIAVKNDVTKVSAEDNDILCNVKNIVKSRDGPCSFDASEDPIMDVSDVTRDCTVYSMYGTDAAVDTNDDNATSQNIQTNIDGIDASKTIEGFDVTLSAKNDNLQTKVGGTDASKGDDGIDTTVGANIDNTTLQNIRTNVDGTDGTKNAKAASTQNIQTNFNGTDTMLGAHNDNTILQNIQAIVDGIDASTTGTDAAMDGITSGFSNIKSNVCDSFALANRDNTFAFKIQTNAVKTSIIIATVNVTVSKDASNYVNEANDGISSVRDVAVRKLDGNDSENCDGVTVECGLVDNDSDSNIGVAAPLAHSRATELGVNCIKSTDNSTTGGNGAISLANVDSSLANATNFVDDISNIATESEIEVVNNDSHDMFDTVIDDLRSPSRSGLRVKMQEEKCGLKQCSKSDNFTDEDNLPLLYISKKFLQGSKSNYGTLEKLRSGFETPERPIQGSMFDVDQFFDDVAGDEDSAHHTELEMNDDLPEILYKDKISDLNRAKVDVGSDSDRDLLDELPDLTETPRSKRRRLMERSPASTIITLDKNEKMMSQLLNISMRSGDSPQEFLDGSQLIKELGNLYHAEPRSPRNSRKRSRSSEASTLRIQPSYSAILIDTNFSRSYKKHGPCLKKLAREKKKDHEVDAMEKILLSELKMGGFRETLERAEGSDAETSTAECDEDTRRAIDLMQQDWGTLPRFSSSSCVFKGGKLELCHHNMELKSYFTVEELDDLSPLIRKTVESVTASSLKKCRGNLPVLLEDEETMMQTNKWLLQVMQCHPDSDTIQHIIQSNLSKDNSDQSQFNYSSLKFALSEAGIETSLFGKKLSEKMIREESSNFSICENCLRKRRRRKPRNLLSIVKVFSAAFHLRPQTLTQPKQIEYISFLLLLLQDEKFIVWSGDVIQMISVLLKNVKDWEVTKYLIARQFLKFCSKLNVVQEICERLHFHDDRTHELCRIISFAVLKLNVFVEEIKTVEIGDFDNMEALVDIVDHLNPDNLELLLPEDSPETIGSQKRSYYHLSLLLPLLNICLGSECKDNITVITLERITSILRTMNKRIRDNGAIYRSQVKYELSLFTKNLRILIQKAPKQNKASIFKYLRSAPVHEQIIGNSINQSSDDNSSCEGDVSYQEDEHDVKVHSSKLKKTPELDGFDIAEVLKSRIIGSAGKR